MNSEHSPAIVDILAVPSSQDAKDMSSPAVLLKFVVISLVWLKLSAICSKSNQSIAEGSPDIFWINLDRSVSRKHFMLHQLRYYDMETHNRMRAFLPSQVFIDDELALPVECKTLSNTTMKTLLAKNDTAFGSKVFVQTHCGRPKNTRKELTVTLSHLHAIRSAIYNKKSKSDYAVILEDDLQFVYQVNFTAMVESAPPNFGILQLITSNEYSVKNLYNVFLRHKSIWVKRRQADDYWCAGGYVINKKVLKPHIDAILSPYSHSAGQSLLLANINAGYEVPCWPKHCCQGSKLAVDWPQCIKAPRGYQSDHFLFQMALADTYMLTVPIMTGSVYGNTSTFHQHHVGLHVSAFNRINSIVQEMTASNSLPPFVNPTCRYNASQDEEFHHLLRMHKQLEV